MKTIGFLVSHKNSEKRRAILPADLKHIKNKDFLYFEEGYGNSLGIDDEEYKKCGVKFVSRKEVLDCDILVDVKLGDADYLDELNSNKILVGWAHAVQNIDFTTNMINKGHTVIAWEEMYEEGRYVFYKNREIAGEAGVLQAYLYCGKMPYDTKVAILGNGQTAKGAFRFLSGLGANVDIYNRKFENLFKKKMYDYDVLVNCILWDTSRTDRIIYKEDLKKMKKGTLIIDISCDPYLEIETSHPTTISDPVYVVDGVIHYAVDNTPAMFSNTVSNFLSKEFCKYVDEIAEGTYSDVIKNATVIEKGKIIDKRISNFRAKNNIK